MIFEEFRQAAVTTKGERVWDLPLPNGSSNRMAGKYGWKAKLEKAAGSASPCPKVRLPQLPSLQGHRGTVELHSQLRAAAAPSLNHFCEGYMLNGSTALPPVTGKIRSGLGACSRAPLLGSTHRHIEPSEMRRRS